MIDNNHFQIIFLLLAYVYLSFVYIIFSPRKIEDTMYVILKFVFFVIHSQLSSHYHKYIKPFKQVILILSSMELQQQVLLLV